MVALGYFGALTYDWWRDRPIVHTSLGGIKLGMSESDVIFENGTPTKIDRDYKREIESVLTYGEQGIIRTVGFKEGKAVSISKNIPIGTFDYLTDDGPRLTGGTKLKRIEEVYGPPASLDQTPSGSIRFINYPAFNIEFWVLREGVIYVRVYDGSKLKDPTTRSGTFTLLPD